MGEIIKNATSVGRYQQTKKSSFPKNGLIEDICDLWLDLEKENKSFGVEISKKDEEGWMEKEVYFSISFVTINSSRFYIEVVHLGTFLGLSQVLPLPNCCMHNKLTTHMNNT